ncbi:MAG TPA: J domain-containing protein, partial [Massilia timonae]|nr:J domain-containing protein [Massilia timonae]
PFVQQRSNFTFDKLAAGKYEVRYQNVVDGASKSECDGRHTALRQAAADMQ